MKRILTYGTFDLLHYGHIRLLKRAKALGDYLIVALSTEEFNELKDKYEVEQNVDEFNLEALDVFLKYKVITKDSVSKLVESKKLNIPNVDTVLSKYE